MRLSELQQASKEDSINKLYYVARRGCQKIRQLLLVFKNSVEVEKLELIIIRHAPTVNNIKNIFMGVDDIDLTTEGLEKASLLKPLLAERPIAICYTSPLKRAKGTAEAIFPKSMISITDKLIERDLGDWAGLSKSDVKTQYPEAFNDEGLLDFFHTPPKGEGAKIMIDRLVDFLVDLKKHDENTLLAIVTHNGVYRVLKSLITGMPLKEIFRQFENYLEPKSFNISKERIDHILKYPYETAENNISLL